MKIEGLEYVRFPICELPAAGFELSKIQPAGEAEHHIHGQAVFGGQTAAVREE